jgi:hypothetical protein
VQELVQSGDLYFAGYNSEGEALYGRVPDIKEMH